MKDRKPTHFKNHDRRERPIANEIPAAPAEGIVSGRNAVRELLASGRDIDKIFVARGDREGSIVALVGELNDAFDIEIKPNNLVPENFNSADAMLALIEKLQDE